VSRATRLTLTEQIARLHTALSEDGVALNDMRHAQSLELQYAGATDLAARPKRAIGNEPLEGPIEARPVTRVSPRESPPPPSCAAMTRAGARSFPALSSSGTP
jgi:hypothetical protein